MLPFYKARDTPLHRLHPVAKLALALSIVVAALILSHPVYLVALLAGTVGLAVSAKTHRDWWRFIQLSISLEGIAFGAMMALRLFVVVSAFTVISLTLHPDEFTQVLARVAYRSGLAVSLSTRFYPAVVRDASAIMNAQRSRGLDLDSGSRFSRIRRRIPVVIPLFHSSLERAVGTAEAMEARGFGTAKRTRWRKRWWSASDGFGLVMSFLLLLYSVVLTLLFDGAPDIYPTIEVVVEPFTLANALVLVILVIYAGNGGGRSSGGGGASGR